MMTIDYNINTYYYDLYIILYPTAESVYYIGRCPEQETNFAVVINIIIIYRSENIYVYFILYVFYIMRIISYIDIL